MSARSLAPPEVARRGELGRRPHQAGEHGRFGERELLRRLGEVAPRGRIDPVGAGAEVGRVQVAQEDLLLAELALQPEGNDGLLDLAAQVLVGRQEHEARQLLGDGAAALARAAGLPVAPGGPQDAPRIDAKVAVEPAVLDGHDGLGKVGGHVGRRDLGALEDAAGREGLAVVRLDDQGARGRVDLQAAVERQGRDAVADDQGQQDAEAAGDDEGVAEPDAPQDALHSRANTCCTSDDRLAPWAEDCRGAGRRSTRPAQGASVHKAGPCHRPFGQPPAFLHGPPACRWHPRGQPPEAGGSQSLRGFRQRQDVPLRLGSGRLIRSWGGCRHDPRLSIAAILQPGHAIRVAPGRPTCAQPKRGRSRASATASPERRLTSSQDGGNERPGRTVTFNSNNPIIISLI